MSSMSCLWMIVIIISSMYPLQLSVDANLAYVGSFIWNDQQNSKSKDPKLMQSQTMVSKATAHLIFYEN